MAENTEEIPAALWSIPCEDPPLPTAADGEENPTKEEEEESDTDRQQPKRRKNCPTSLDKFEAIKQSSTKSTFSFTFDTDFVATPESTPKFGSFNSAAPEIVHCHQIPATSKIKAEEDEEEEEVDEDYDKSEVSEEREQVVGVLSPAEGVELESRVDSRV